MKTIRSAWIRTERQIDFLGRIWNTLDIELQEHQNELLDELASKLDAAGKQIARAFRKTGEEEGEVKVNRMKYAAIKGSIDRSIAQLREWQRDFDPGWFLIMKIAKPEDRGVTNTILMARNVRKYMNIDIEENFEMFRKHDTAAKLEPITYSAVKLVQRTGKGGTQNYIVDTVPCLKGVEVNILIKDIRERARKLSVADPFTFGLLQCRGVVKINASLTSKIQIARQLAQSASYVHPYGFVHKSIWPDTILIFEDYETDLAASFLLGFQRFPTAYGKTLMTGDSVWNKDLYRHPQRQGLSPENEYVMQHDVYSLGVCLLEIGLWEVFYNVDFANPEELKDEDGVQVGARYIEKIIRHLNSTSV
ncbi:het-s domain protein [Paraphaeosphaeria sporulosa]